MYKYSTQLTKHTRVDCEGEDIIGKTYHKHSFLKDYRIQTETYHQMKNILVILGQI